MAVSDRDKSRVPHSVSRAALVAISALGVPFGALISWLAPWWVTVPACVLAFIVGWLAAELDAWLTGRVSYRVARVTPRGETDMAGEGIYD